jgi:SAM-dependent MidA family methyltransferase
LPAEISLPPPSAEASARSAELTALIAREIGAAGWISFARFMELALYAPRLGYYAGGAAQFGAEGDFTTAPEISALFTQTLARQVLQVLRLGAEEVVELGAGSGRMACDLLEALHQLGVLPARYSILEVSAELRGRQQQRLGTLPSAIAGRVRWIDRVPDRIDGIVLANEVLDAMPVHVIAWHDERIDELGVAWRDGRLSWSQRKLAPGPLRERALALPPKAPYVSEVSLAAPALVRTLAAALERGVLLFVDYGFGSPEYYHPQRSRGTLMCHYRHRVHDDPFFLPGLQDITSHVDFTAVATAGIESGLKLLGYTTQAHFLVNAGITEILSHTAPEDAGVYLPLSAQAQQLLSPAEMGELFKVIALGRGIGEPLRGFSAGDQSGLL